MVANEGDRNEGAVAESLDLSTGVVGEAQPLLAEWGWEENVFREFTPVEETADGTNFLSVSVHRFRDADAADAALAYFSDAVLVSGGAEDVEVEPLGDEVRALQSSEGGVTNLILYVRSGPFLFRIGSSSPAGDPTADAVALAQSILPS